jgi:hypothetical protein
MVSAPLVNLHRLDSKFTAPSRAPEGLGLGHWGAIQSASPCVSIEVSPISLVDAGEIDSALSAFARSPNGGLA